MITFRRQKNLRFVLKPTKGLAMKDTITIFLKGGTHQAGLFSANTAEALSTQACMTREHLRFTIFQYLTNVHTTTDLFNSLIIA
jgi:hypothetical protein